MWGRLLGPPSSPPIKPDAEIVDDILRRCQFRVSPAKFPSRDEDYFRSEHLQSFPYIAHHGATPRPHLPVSKQLRSAPRNTRDLACRPPVMASQLFVFTLGPKDQILVQFAHRRIKRRAIIAPVILEPASDNRIEHPRQIFNRLVAAVRQVPAPKSVANRLCCLVRDCRTEIDEELPLAIL
jgi:hypothetical protein